MFTVISKHMHADYKYPLLHYLDQLYRNHFMKVLCITTVVIPTLMMIFRPQTLTIEFYRLPE